MDVLTVQVRQWHDSLIAFHKSAHKSPEESVSRVLNGGTNVCCFKKQQQNGTKKNNNNRPASVNFCILKNLILNKN